MRACINCSRAKVKCIWPANHDDDDDDDHNVCQRCSKANLTCTSAGAVSGRKRGKAVHAKIIEQKLDKIMDMLSADQGRARNPPMEDPPTSLSQAEKSTPPEAIQSTSSTQSSQHPGSIDIVPGFKVTFYEADRFLQEYSTTMLPQFPFVPISTHNARDLLEDKPLLLKTILWVCRPPPPEAFSAFEEWFRQTVAQRTIVQMNKSLEVVQAILVFLAWKDIYLFAATGDTSLLQIAAGLVADLGLLDSPCRTQSAPFGSIFEGAAQLTDTLPGPATRTSNGDRAGLGTYMITSALSTLLTKRCKLDYTKHFDHFCQQLIQNREYATDPLLVSLVQVQRIAKKANDVFWEMKDLDGDQNSGSFHSIAVASILNELDLFIQQLPHNLKQNRLLQIHCSAVRIRLLEPQRLDKEEMVGPVPHTYRTYWECLESTKALLQIFFSIPAESYPHLTFLPILHLALAIIKAFRLLCVKDLGVDLTTARTTYDLPSILEKLSESFEKASELGSPRCTIILHGRPIFSEYAEAYRGIQRWYLHKLSQEDEHQNWELNLPVVADSGPQNQDYLFWNQLSDLANEFI